MNVIPLAAPVLPSMQDILDTLPAHVAVVDEAGVIVCVNRAWVAFGTAGGLTDAAFCVGTNYLDLCDQVTGDCAADARKLARALRSVLSGQTLAESMEYPCHSPTEQNWFRADITPVRTGQGLFAMLALAATSDGLTLAINDSQIKLIFSWFAPTGKMVNWHPKINSTGNA